MKKIKCEECGEFYKPRKRFNPAVAFAWCPKCSKEYHAEYKRKLIRAIKKQLDNDFKSEYEKDKFFCGK